MRITAFVAASSTVTLWSLVAISANRASASRSAARPKALVISLEETAAISSERPSGSDAGRGETAGSPGAGSSFDALFVASGGLWDDCGDVATPGSGVASATLSFDACAVPDASSGCPPSRRVMIAVRTCRQRFVAGQVQVAALRPAAVSTTVSPSTFKVTPSWSSLVISLLPLAASRAARRRSPRDAAASRIVSSRAAAALRAADAGCAWPVTGAFAAWVGDEPALMPVALPPSRPDDPASPPKPACPHRRAGLPWLCRSPRGRFRRGPRRRAS